MRRQSGGFSIGVCCILVVGVWLLLWPYAQIESSKAHFAELLALPLVPGAWHGFKILEPRARIAVGFLFGSWLLSTILSVYRPLSLWGNPARGRGILFELACLTVFLFVIAQPRRGIWAILWAMRISGPLVLLGVLLARLGLLPATNGLTGTVGSPSFLRDFLVVWAIVVTPSFRAKPWLVAIAAMLFVVWTVHWRAPSALYRVHMWQAAAPAVLEHPLTGWGPDTLELPLMRYAHEAVHDEPMRQDRTENLWLDALLERGDVGLAAEMIFWGMILWIGRRSRYRLALIAALGLEMISVISVPMLVWAYVLAGLLVLGDDHDAVGSRAASLSCGATGNHTASAAASVV